MVDNIVTKPLGLVLIIAAHMVFNGPSQAAVTGILSTNITLQFTFNVSITKQDHFAVYTNQNHQRKIAQYPQGDVEGAFVVYPTNMTVFYHITALKLHDSGSYWVSLFIDKELIESNKVQLIVREENRSSTVPPMPNNITTPEDSESPFLSHVVLVVSPVVLLAALLPCLIWCLVRTRDKQQQPPPQQQTSNQTLQETVEASNNVPASSLVYSVLDFPKRPLAVLEVNPSDTEYAAVSYLPENRQV